MAATGTGSSLGLLATFMPAMDITVDGKPSVTTALALLNKYPPITSCQFEIWYNFWPKAKWVARGITIPGLKTNTVDIFYNGFAVPIIINTTYSTHELSMDILADQDGMYYREWRDLVIYYSRDDMKGRPRIDNDSKYMVVKLMNPSKGKTAGHFWRIHDFRPTEISEIQMSQSSSDLVTFTITGTFNYISYTNEETDSNVLEEAAKKEMGASATAGGASTQGPLIF